MPQIHAPPDAPAADPVRAALADPRVLREIQLASRRLVKPGHTKVSWSARKDAGDELASKAIATALEKASGFDPDLGRSVSAWIIGFARNIVRKPDRGSAGSDCSELLMRKADPSPSVQDAFILRADRELVRQAMSRLNPDERELVRSRYFQAEETRGIASKIGIAPGTVRVNLYRARKKLYDMLSPSFEGGRS